MGRADRMTTARLGGNCNGKCFLEELRRPEERQSGPYLGDSGPQAVIMHHRLRELGDEAFAPV